MTDNPSGRSPGGASTSRPRILDRIRAANDGRAPVPHPGDFEGWLPAPRATPGPAVERFAGMFEAAGGEVVRVPDLAGATRWLGGFSEGFAALVVGRGVPDEVVPPLPRTSPEEAPLAVSAARLAIAETGSLVLDARDGRRTQLLSPTHVVIVSEGAIVSGARDAFRRVRSDLSAAIGLHSGPSKSADIGQVMVEGVHGPGRLIALLVSAGPAPSGEVG